MGDEGARQLAHALQAQQEQRRQQGGEGQLTVLELGFNHISAVGLAPLFAALRGCRAMQALHLDNNDIDDEGAEHMAAALPYMPRLQLLDVGFNHITAAGVKGLARALAGNSSLRSLTLSGNALQSEGARAVAEALALNAGLAELHLDHASIGQSGERVLAAALEQAPFPGLKTLTGVRLGPVLARLGQAQGFPPELDGASNEHVLEWLRLRRQTQQQPTDLGALLRAIVAAGEDSASSSVNGDGSGEEPTMMALSTPPLPTFYGRSAGGKTTPPTGGAHSHAHAHGGHSHPHAHTGIFSGAAGLPPRARAPAAAASSASAPHQPLPPHVAQGLAECGHMPWDPAELFALHQRYFSPPPKLKITSPPQPQYHPHHPQRAVGLGARKREELEEEEQQQQQQQQQPPPALPTPMQRVESEGAFPPAPKKQCVTTPTLVRIGLYPRLKARIELMLKGGVQEQAVLVLLRQLRFLEHQSQQQAAALAPEHLEAILLDTVS